MVATGRKRNIDEVMDAVERLWSPYVIAEVTDYDLKAANVGGEYVEHVHTGTDEIFIVLSGRLTLTLPDGEVVLGPMDVYTVPRGVRHRPSADPGTRILMVEPRGTSQDGADGSTGIRLPDPG